MLEGIELMVVGMAVVFVFLALLVISVRLTNLGLKAFNRFFPEKEETIQTTIQRATSKNDDIAVAIAAVQAFIKK